MANTRQVVTRTPNEWKEALFPEAEWGPLRNHLGIFSLAVTLDSLGLRRSCEAEERGYICIRPAVAKSMAGLWVHESHRERLENAIPIIAEHRRQEQERHEAIERDVEARAILRKETLRTATEEELLRYPHLAEDERAVLIGWAQRNGKAPPHSTIRYLIGTMRASRLARAAGVQVSSDGRALALVLPHAELEVSVGPEVARIRVALGTKNFSDSELDSLLEEDSVVVETLRTMAESTEKRAIAAITRDLDAFRNAVRNTANALPADLREPWCAEFHAEIDGKVIDVKRLAPTVRKRSTEWAIARRKQEIAALKSPFRIKIAKGKVTAQYSVDLPLEIGGATYTAPIRILASEKNLVNKLIREGAAPFIANLTRRIRDEERIRTAEWQAFAKEFDALITEASQIEGFDHPQLVAELQRTLSSETTAPAETLKRLRKKHATAMRAAIEANRVALAITDNKLDRYLDLFPRARRLKRTLRFYAGPTNSGKTHRALDDLAAAESGVYLAPLRLLALEGQQKLLGRGVETSFLTGEERDLREGASFVASTIEMMDTRREVEVAVIDEIQMIGDPHRGWAWAQALIGVPAHTVVMTGSPDAIPLVQEIAAYTGEELEIIRLPRLSPLEPLEEPVALKDIEPGTAIIAFSRREVLGLKEVLEKDHRTAVIYGALSPEVRREEARRFREGEADVLVATDAIAMGLNLPIRTILFYAIDKWNGSEDVPLTTSEILQIGGRAGRYGIHEGGRVSTVYGRDHRRVVRAINAAGSLPDLPLAVQVRPSLEHIEALSEALGQQRLDVLLDVFARRVRFDTPLLYAGKLSDMMELARRADEHRNLSLADRFQMACAPVDLRDVATVEVFMQGLHALAHSKPLAPPEWSGAASSPAGDSRTLQAAESAVKSLTVYAWMAYRWPQIFTGLEECDHRRAAINRWIEKALRSKGIRRRCSNCGSALPPLTRHGMCDDCFRGNRSWREDF